MSNADKTTIKLRAHPGKVADEEVHSNLSEEQNKALEQLKRNAQLEQEKNKSLELEKAVEQLKQSLKLEQAKTAEMANMALGLEEKLKELAELESKVKKVSELESKVQELSELLGKISGIAATGKSNQ